MISIPGASMGTRTMLCLLWGGTELRSPWVLPMKMATLHLGSIAPLIHHLVPFNTTSSPSTRTVASMLVASELATEGSVIAKQLLIFPSKRGFKNASCCSLLPYLASTSIFPVSGALQLNTSGAMREWPVSSAMIAYSRLVNPAPNFPLSVSLGKNIFHSPSPRAFNFNSSKTGDGCHLSFPSYPAIAISFSLGITFSLIKLLSLRIVSTALELRRPVPTNKSIPRISLKSFTPPLFGIVSAEACCKGFVAENAPPTEVFSIDLLYFISNSSPIKADSLANSKASFALAALALPIRLLL
mmetsp:Transcript_25542/g.37728  ORF Transcript_25542/g.37728 Transcript_25542/m.37728 type:complete len:299 (-) Transcript_25542:1119-2015(-)